MKKIAYTLSTCDTSKKILKAAGIQEPDFIIKDIKKVAISEMELDEMKMMTGSFESLFSRRAQKYKSMGLKDKALIEADYKKLILEEYTFLKRPVIIIGKDIFVGNSKANIEALIQSISQ